mgnify:CR=1 FL=1
MDAAEKEKIEAAILATEAAIKAGDIADIEAKTKVLTDVSSGLAQKMYAEQAEAGQAAPEAEKAQGADDVVDAEFEEVKDNK